MYAKILGKTRTQDNKKQKKRCCDLWIYHRTFFVCGHTCKTVQRGYSQCARSLMSVKREEEKIARIVENKQYTLANLTIKRKQTHTKKNFDAEANIRMKTKKSSRETTNGWRP